jgi:cytochrome c peroxidase
VNPFTSKYDYYLKGMATLSAQETWGLELFNDTGKCALCHISEAGPGGEPPLFTDFTYDNLGIPKNPDNPFYTMPRRWNPDGMNWVDYGLGGFLKKAGFAPNVYGPELGKHKVPTLRNVDLRPYPDFIKAFGHNGYFKSLEEIVHFYNTRDVESWPPAEVPETVNIDELGNLGLTLEEEAAIVAFMKTLSDGYIL